MLYKNCNFNLDNEKKNVHSQSTMTGQLVLNNCFFHCVMSGWLDDIGLPQYKDSFSEGSVDGHMLNYLTYVSNDILLEVVSC